MQNCLLGSWIFPWFVSTGFLDDQSGKKSINDKNLKKTMEDEDKDSEEEKMMTVT